MKRLIQTLKTMSLSVLLASLLQLTVQAQEPSQDPLFLVAPVKPIMMFNMSKDHQLFFKLYDDYSDITGDGNIDTTYNNSFDYYGYFDSKKCYIYDSANGRFSPLTTPAVNHYCQETTDTTRYWSGNFLNWATMTRMDAVRKILYGGYRSTDTNTLTVLERAFLPNDAHSFAKWYGGSDLRRLTPYDDNSAAADARDRGLTLCNTSEVNNRVTYSQNATGANDRPVIRLARGNYSLWASNERWQCRWGINSNGNVPASSGIDAYSNSPNQNSLDVTTNLSGQVQIGANSSEVNLVSGDDFNGLSVGGSINIDGTNYTINALNSSTQLNVNTAIDPPLTGTVRITSSSDLVNLVTGTFSGLAVNDVINIEGSNRTILAINSGTQIRVNHTYPLATGNVFITSGSNQINYVASSGTNFANLNSGDSITIDGQVRSITSKNSNTQIVVNHTYPQTSVSGKVTITSNSNVINYVASSGTNFANLSSGNSITIDGVVRTVNTKNNNSQIVVNTTYPKFEGTVNLTAGSNVVTYAGTGINFQNYAVGDTIRINSVDRLITGKISNTQITVNTTYATTQTGRNYTVASIVRDYSANVSGVQTTVPYSSVVSRNVSFSATKSTRTANYTASYITPEANAEMIARVVVDCSGSSTKCRRYVPTSGAYAGQDIDKPIGLLQEYANKVNFGLMTGSYRKSKSGGVLRKMVGPIDVKDSANDTTTDEIGDDGIFKVPSTSGNSIIKTLDLFRAFGYDFNVGTYNDARPNGDNCDWALSFFDDELSGAGTGRCSNWGNPQAEIFLESLRYLAGTESASADFATDDATFIAGLNRVANWDDPIIDGASGNKCAALNILQFNASTTSYDNDNLGVGVADISFTEAGIRAATTNIGTLEGVNSAGTGSPRFFVGSNSDASDPANVNQLCTPKNISSATGGLGAVNGVCSESPRLEGGYNIAGLAYLARKNGIGNDREKVKTHGVVLAPAIPSISVPTPDGSKSITILPACRNNTPNPDANCAIVDFKVVSGPTLASGRYTGSLYVNWEDSEQGGDYDQDMWGVMSYEVTDTAVVVRTRVMAQSSGDRMGFGYVISGTTEDGFHVHSGINDFVYPGSACVGTACRCRQLAGGGNDPSHNPCQAGIAIQTERNFVVGTSAAKKLQNPLWYAAKWGGYTKTGLTDAQIAATDPEAETADNIRTFFYATNPATLESALAKLFETIAGSVGSASTVAANSTSSQGDTHIYQARFDSQDWSGQVLDFALTASGVSNTPNWNTHTTMARSSGFVATRKVYTYDGTTPSVVELTDLDLTDASVLSSEIPTLIASLKQASEPDFSVAVKRLEWLFGDDSEENKLFRVRTHLLGDIINSDPGYAGGASQRHNSLPPAVAFGSSTYTGYVATKKDRRKLVFVGANDGMLHAFDAADGKEVFAYIPRGVYKKLTALSNINYTHQYTVDGPVYVSDYYRESDDTWRTIVAGTLGSGGRGAYALDVTDILNSATETTPEVIFDISDDDTTTAQPNATLKNDVGYSGSKVLVLPVNASAADGGGRWMAVFSNGVGSVNGSAKLIAIDVNDPTAFVSIDTGTTGNGLSPAAYLSGAQNVITAAYAGDVKGNLWKFDLSNADYTQWGSAYKVTGTPVPLIKLMDPSGTPQPVTSEPTLGLNSLKLVGGEPSIMVYVGTGQYSYTSDLTDTSVQSIYGIADSGSAISVLPLTRSTLLHEKIISAEANGRRAIINDKTGTTTPAVDWSTKRGWFIDLVVKEPPSFALGTQYGERVLNKPLLISDRIIMNTFVPSTFQCDYGGSGWLLELVGVGDKYIDHSVLNGNQNDANGDGIPDQDSDGDGVLDLDVNGDGVVDPDGDGDGISDLIEPDTDSDGVIDDCDTDPSDDKVKTTLSSCPFILDANMQLNRPIISDLVPIRSADSITIIGSNLGGKKSENLPENSTITTIEGDPGDDSRGRMSWRQIK